MSELGCTALVLAPLDSMRPAIALNESFGFVCAGAHYDTPLAGTVFFALHV